MNDNASMPFNLVPLHFEGYSDDTFGEVFRFMIDVDNCASGEPIVFRVFDPVECVGLLVVGQYYPGPAGSWQIGVASLRGDFDELPLPPWPIRIERSERTYSPRLVIEAPPKVVVECIDADGDVREDEA